MSDSYRDNDAHLVRAFQFAEGCIDLGEKFEFTTDELTRAFAERLGLLMSQVPQQEVLKARPAITSPTDTQDTLTDWQNFYKEVFNLNVDLSEIQVPVHKEDFDRIIVVAQGLTINQVIEACRKHFKVWTCIENLDKAVTENDRTPAEASYAIRIRDRREADKELKNLSADQLKKQNINGITLLECLLYELKYWKETGKCLDIQNITLCTGSRDSDGGVPRVYWGVGKLCVHWCHPRGASSALRSRVVIL